jgi:acyl CoA:acetate/3-ketoacid CoA transferase alpha subunit
MTAAADIAVVRARIADLAGTALLSPDEQRRAGAMGSAAARAFVAGRTLLRRLLSRWLDLDPRPIELCEEPDA